MREHALEDAPRLAVLVHPELDEVAQEAAALRSAESERVTNAAAASASGFAVPLSSARS